jgi:D-tyrosyl-tRNA(Tyr) deacylase
MKVVIQRVSRASVTIEQKTKASIHNGLLIFLGIGYADTQEDIDYLVKKTVQMRIFDDAEGVMNFSVKDIDGDVLVVSQFTLMASCKKGNRPSYIEAAKPDISIPLYKAFCKAMSEAMEKTVETGEFGADMQVELVNNGPVTICLDSKDRT